MTGRERVNRAMEGRDQDRAPRTETFWPETQRRFREEAGIRDHQELFDRIGSDFAIGPWIWPSPFQDRGHQTLEEDEETRVVIDGFGQKTRVWKNKDGTPEHLGWECDGPEIWRDKFRPAYENLSLSFDPDHVRELGAIGTEKDRWRPINGVEPFECLRKLIGDEATMIGMIEEPDWIAEMAKVTTDVMLRNFQGVLDCGYEADGIWVYGDMAFKSATFCSPATYRELIWPQHKRFADWAHDRGLKMIYHTDGDVNGVMDLYVEAGFDAVQPLEAKASMDIRELCPKYGDRLTMFGNMDVMKYAFGSIEEIEEEIRTKMEAGKATRRYIFHSDHSIPPQVSWELYEQILEFRDRYQWY